MDKKDPFDNFNKFAENYHEICNEAISKSGADSNYFSENKVLELLKFEKSDAHLKILDFGCGDGNSSVFIKKHFPNINISGVDVSEKSIDIANNRCLSECKFSAYDGRQLPYSDNHFDIIFTSMVFHHINPKLHKEILEEIFRVLRKGGRFYNFEHNPYNPLTRKAVGDCEYDKNAILLKPSYNNNITLEAGFSVKNLHYTLFFPRFKFLKFILGLEKMLTWCPLGAQYYIRAIKNE